MMDWLIGNCDLLGLPCQNWMWVFGAGLLIYIAVLVVAGRRRTAGAEPTERLAPTRRARPYSLYGEPSLPNRRGLEENLAVAAARHAVAGL